MTLKMKPEKHKKSASQDEESRVHVLVQQMLISRIFVASFIGRFYVEHLKAYRDVIRIDNQEIDLIKNLCFVKRRIENFYTHSVWAAITGPEESIPEGYCLWVNIHSVPFGTYWFTIENVNFSDHGEMEIKVRVVRSIEDESPPCKTLDNKEKLRDIKKDLCDFFEKTITWENCKESVKFIFVLLMTIGTASLYGLQYLGDFSLRLFREFNNFVKVSTPIIIAILDVISKTIGGFYILIAMLWRRGNVPPQFPGKMLPLPPPQRPHKSFAYQRRPYM